MISQTETPRTDFVAVERERMRREYQRRARDVEPNRYAASQPFARFEVEVRNRRAERLLRSHQLFPKPGDDCLEVGFGSQGWFTQLISWGVQETELHGIELDPERAARARDLFPKADLRLGDAVNLPWDSGTFKLVIASTIFTSILDPRVRRLIADEIVRVMAPGGALLWYDFAYDNPRNRNVRGIPRREIRQLFPGLRGGIQRVTLAPPLGRIVVPRSRALATFLEGIPLLRTHLLAVLTKA